MQDQQETGTTVTEIIDTLKEASSSLAPIVSLALPVNSENPSPEDMRKILSYDPIQHAEELMGTSYKQDESTGIAGLLLSMESSRQKNQMLESQGDTTLHNKLDRYLEIVTGLGFEVVLMIPFTDEGYPYKGDSPVVNETLYIMANRRVGALLCFDTYQGHSVNGGHVYYAWRPIDPEASLRSRVMGNGDIISQSEPNWRKDPKYNWNGLPSDWCWVGGLDCREALKFNLTELEKTGSFIHPWPDKPFMWLLHYMDTKVEGYDYKAINAERIAMLPDWVRKMMGITE